MDGNDHPAKLAIRLHRERVVAQLTDAFSRDEIGIEAFETRIGKAYRSKSAAELDALVADVRGHDSAEKAAMILANAEIVRPASSTHALATALAPVSSRPVLRALFSNIQRSDRAVVSGVARVEAIFGTVELDLRETCFDCDVTELRVKAVFGSIEIAVPADIHVEVHGAAVFGNFEGATRTTADPDAPTLRIVGSAIFASVVVRTVPPLRVQKLATELRARRLLRP
jgi:Cell wall-active antibiotics response 4TMS YvqF/Domain of unknown function (DUF1707)